MNELIPQSTRILVGSNNLFFPQYGGGDMAFMEWLVDLNDNGVEIVIITTFPEIEGFEKELPFEVIRLLDKIPYDVKLEELNISTMDGNLAQVLKTEFEVDVNDRKLLDKGVKALKNQPSFDYYIGWGPWGCGWEIGPFQAQSTFAKKIKDNYPEIITMHLAWDLHSQIEVDTECDMFLHGAPYELIRNPNAITYEGVENKPRIYLYPKQHTFETITQFNYDEWLGRPYDFIFNNPLIYKGSPIIINLALHYPQKKFLVKQGKWGFSMGYDKYQYWLEKMRDIPNIDIIDSVNCMEIDFFRKGRYLLYPSISEGFGLMPLEAAMQGTIPLCSDIGILRWSSAPFGDFVYSDALTFNPIELTGGWGGIDKIDFHRATIDWLDKINFLDNNEAYVKLLYKDLNYVETFVDERYWNSFNDFITTLTLMKQENIPIHKSHEN